MKKRCCPGNFNSDGDREQQDGTVGYRAGMTMNLKTGDGAVCLANPDNGSNLGLEFLAAVANICDWPMFPLNANRTDDATGGDVEVAARALRFADGPTISVVYEQEVLILLFPNGDRYAMTPIVGVPREFIHSAAAVRASFEGVGKEATIRLYGETGRRLADAE